MLRRTRLRLGRGNIVDIGERIIVPRPGHVLNDARHAVLLVGAPVRLDEGKDEVQRGRDLVKSRKSAKTTPRAMVGRT